MAVYGVTQNLANETALAARAAVEPEAFAAIYEHYFGRVFTYIRCRVANDLTADDLTAQVFERALTKISRYQPELAPFGAWLFGIARHTVNNHQRAERRRGWLPLDFLARKAAPDPRPEEIAIHNEAQESLWSALNSLREQERELIVLKYVAGLSGQEIAGLTGLTENNVSVSLHRARAQLKTRLSEPHSQPGSPAFRPAQKGDNHEPQS